jgi:redox-sensitive bicupin YhaK (pirin superfamily)
MTGDRLLEPREVPLGGVRGLLVHRTLPHRDLPTVGAWCFVDHFGPTREPMTVLPHPHTGLQTVTWPLAGDIRHRDSLGSDVVLRPGELNLMTSGDGVSHSEFSVGSRTMMHGVQLWVALPDDSRAGPADFEHLPDLPRTRGNGWRAIVLVGGLADVESPATTYSPIMGAELTVGAGAAATVPLQPEYEHAVLAVDGPVRVGGFDLAHRQVRYLEPGRSSVDLLAARDATVMLIGGEPFTESLVMWWNFIGRSHDDIAQAREEWEEASDRFGHVEGHDGQLIPAPPMPGVRLTPRRRRD